MSPSTPHQPSPCSHARLMAILGIASVAVAPSCTPPQGPPPPPVAADIPITKLFGLDPATALGRFRAHSLDSAHPRRKRDVHNLALDPVVTGWASAIGSAEGSVPMLALDGDAVTAWRGRNGQGPWNLEIPFRRPVHVGLVRMHFGDTSTSGVPAAYHWEVVAPKDGSCEQSRGWVRARGAGQDDRHPNEFLHGPRDVHAQKQAWFGDIDACGLRFVVDGVDGERGPVVREIAVYESAVSLAREAGVKVTAQGNHPVVRESTPSGAVDGTYEGLWAGDAGAGPWVLQVDLASPRMVDRIRLVLGYDAVTVPLVGRPGTRFSGGYLPVRYHVETAEARGGEWTVVPESLPLAAAGEPLALRRRLIRLKEARRVASIRLVIDQATGPWGETDGAAPVVREIGLYEQEDSRPVLTDPWFLSANANPSGLTRQMKGGEAWTNGQFARDAYHRLRRVIVGFDADTRWPPDAKRERDAGTGRYLEAIQGDDPALGEDLLRGGYPAPVVVLSGGLKWDFDVRTGPMDGQAGYWGWDVESAGWEAGRGMGHLAGAVRGRVAPFIGFCGGAQILALLEGIDALRAAPRDDRGRHFAKFLLRNDNTPIEGVFPVDKGRHERAWWFDPPETDAVRPEIQFDPSDPLFSTIAGPDQRRSTREMPSSHGEMIRGSAFGAFLPGLEVEAWSEFCGRWVREGEEPTWEDKSGGRGRCVRIPQAFRSRNRQEFPVVGFQFHPEQRDLKRLAAGSPEDARGDALNVVANAVALALDAYLRIYWPEQG